MRSPGRLRRLYSAFLLGPVAAACADPALLEELGSRSEHIVGGELSGTSEDSVVDLYAGDEDERAHCTGTLIAPNVVLTALHCVAHFDQYTPFSCSPEGTLTTPAPGGVLGGPLAAETISVHLGAEYSPDSDAQGVRVFSSNSTQICRHDIALVVLDRDLEAPLATLRLQRPTERGERLLAVGFGVNGTEDVRRYKRAGVRVSDVGTDGERPASGSAAPYTLVTGEGPCQGDSGGPAFSEETGAIVGVYSISAAQTCTALGVRNVYTQVAPFRDLIEVALTFAGHSALAEAPLPDAGSPPAPPIADDEDEPNAEDPGSGSREDPSCTCRLPHSAPGPVASYTALLAFALLFARRLNRLVQRRGSVRCCRVTTGKLAPPRPAQPQ